MVTKQTVHRGSRHVESSIKNALKWTPYHSRPESGYLWSQRHCRCVCVCVCLVFSITPLLRVHNLRCKHSYTVVWMPISKNSEVKKCQHEVIASLHLVCRTPKLFRHCEQLYLCLPVVAKTKTAFSACLLHAHKAHVHATGCNSPWCRHPMGYDLRFPFFPWPEAETYCFIQDLIFSNVTQSQRCWKCLCKGARQY